MTKVTINHLKIKVVLFMEGVDVHIICSQFSLTVGYIGGLEKSREGGRKGGDT